MNVFNSMIIVLLIIGLSLSCTDNISSNEVQTVDLEDFNSLISPVYVTNIATNIEYVPLDSRSEILKRVGSIATSKSHIAISDGLRCILFDKQGNYITQIGSKGRGPGEYVSISEIKFFKDHNIIIQSGMNFLIYDLDGTFIRSFTLDIDSAKRPIISWSVIQDSLIFCKIPNFTGGERYKAAILNAQGETLRLFRNWMFWDQKVEYFGTDDSYANLYQMRGDIYIKEVMNDTLYKVDNESFLKPVLSFNLGKYAQPMKDRELHPFEWFRSAQNYIRIQNIFDSPGQIFLDINFNKLSPSKRTEPKIVNGQELWYYTKNLLGVYDKNSKELSLSTPEEKESIFTSTGLYNDFDGGPKFYPVAALSDTTLVMWIEAWQLKNYIKSNEFLKSNPKYPKEKRKLEQLGKSISESDNPVLILLNLKKE